MATYGCDSIGGEPKEIARRRAREPAAANVESIYWRVERKVPTSGKFCPAGVADRRWTHG
jgi:hypothetical protein